VGAGARRDPTLTVGKGHPRQPAVSWAASEGGAAARGALVVVSDVGHSGYLRAARATFTSAGCW
jgi:hypothetical protein